MASVEAQQAAKLAAIKKMMDMNRVYHDLDNPEVVERHASDNYQLMRCKNDTPTVKTMKNGCKLSSFYMQCFRCTGTTKWTSMHDPTDVNGGDKIQVCIVLDNQDAARAFQNFDTQIQNSFVEDNHLFSSSGSSSSKRRRGNNDEDTAAAQAAEEVAILSNYKPLLQYDEEKDQYYIRTKAEMTEVDGEKFVFKCNIFDQDGKFIKPSEHKLVCLPPDVKVKFGVELSYRWSSASGKGVTMKLMEIKLLEDLDSIKARGEEAREANKLRQIQRSEEQMTAEQVAQIMQSVNNAEPVCHI